jgi:TPP-dependent pyruvate/acetoin dehydrogenase alpha subunit
MHLFDRATLFYRGNAIVGGDCQSPLDWRWRTNRLRVVSSGTELLPRANFRESMNLAALWKLPVSFVCENNLYAMGTRLDDLHSLTDLARKAAGYGVPAAAVDGMDVLGVEKAAQSAVEQIRSGGGPYFLECRTYRLRAHSMYDPELPSQSRSGS